MATVNELKKTKILCDTIFAGLDEVKKKIVAMREDVRKKYSGDIDVANMYDRHLAELVEGIDWKLQILSHACPYDWEGSAKFENAVQVEETGKPEFPDFSPGYLGG